MSKNRITSPDMSHFRSSLSSVDAILYESCSPSWSNSPVVTVVVVNTGKHLLTTTYIHTSYIHLPNTPSLRIKRGIDPYTVNTSGCTPTGIHCVRVNQKPNPNEGVLREVNVERAYARFCFTLYNARRHYLLHYI